MRKLIAILLLSVGFLLLLGTVTLFSATTYQPKLDRFFPHLCWIALGGVCCAVACLADHAWLRGFHLPKWLIGFACLLLIAVLVPGIGTVRNGAARWLLSGQPSEFAKLALIIFLADYGAAHQSRMQERNTGFIYPGAVAGVIVLLLFLEPDWGTAALIGAVSLVMLIVAGTHWAYLLSATIIGAELFALLLLRNPLRMDRLMAFRKPELFKSSLGWQGWHSLLSLGSSGWFGAFFGEGLHKNGFVPEQQTDFALALLGEETGFIGTSLVLLLFVLILLCGVRIAWRICDPFGQLLATGITVLIGLQAFINIGVVTSSLPNKGIALPFVSYGGSNLVCMLACLGLLISVARHGPLLESAEHENRFTTDARPKIGGPVGSLLSNSTQAVPKGLRQRLVRWLRIRPNSRFPLVPSHPYQRPPRRTQAG